MPAGGSGSTDERAGETEVGKDDRRQFTRRNKQSIVHFQVIESPDSMGADKEAVVKDYSAGGIRFSAREPLGKNTRISIRFESEEWGKDLTAVYKDPKHSLMDVIGSVMWCLESREIPGEYEIGTQFIDETEQ